MRVRENVSLQNKSTFRLPARARYLVEIRSEEDIREYLADEKLNSLPRFILGDGSNTIFTRDFKGIILHVRIKGKNIIEETKSEVVVRLGAGENWHDFVTWAVEQNWGGVENMALIPGTLGAAPVQNTGAYGQELADTLELLEAVEFKGGESKIFLKADCKFGYRESVFKDKLKGEFLITSVTLRLHKNPTKLETAYFSAGGLHDSIQAELKKFAQKPYTVKDVYQAVINIRTRKLVNPWDGPTVGSFFVNPVVSAEKAAQLQKQDSGLQVYPLDGAERVKIPAGRLLENLGWRGQPVGNVKMSEKHALVMTHNGRATGEEVLRFAKRVRESVWENYGIELEMEVNIT